MKSINKSLLITAALGFITIAAFAIDLVPTSESLAQKIAKKEISRITERVNQFGLAMRIDNYTKVSLAELPQVVKSAVFSKYYAYAIEKASGSGNALYRLVLKGQQKKLIVYYTAEGECLSCEILP